MDSVADEYLKRHLTLLRMAEGEAIELASEMRQIHDKILQVIKERGYESERQVRRLIEEEMHQYYYAAWPGDLEEIASTVILGELLWNKGVMEEFFGELEGVENNIQLRKRAATKAASLPMQGLTIDKWVQKQYGSHSRGIMNVLQEGFVTGRGVEATAREINILMGRYERDVKTITRAHFMQSATAARDEFFEENDDLIDGWAWNSTLDSRTTPLICGVRDQKKYDHNRQPVGHNYEWGAGPGLIHWNCRSNSYPIIEGIEIDAHKASVDAGANYVRGDNLTPGGKVRKPFKPNVDKGIFKVSHVTNKLTYEKWLRQQAAKNIDFVADVLGSKKKATAFLNGSSLEEIGRVSPVAVPIKPNKRRLRIVTND